MASLIVDTGPNLTGPGTRLASGNGSPSGNTSFQNLYGEFTTTQAYYITSLQGYMWIKFGGPVNFVIYGNNAGTPGNDKPNVSDIKYAYNSFATPAGTQDAGNYGNGSWVGPTGLDHYLPADTYWIGFTVDSTQSFWGAMMGTGLTNPLVENAYSIGNPITDFGLNGGNQLGVQIGGQTTDPNSAVPIPAAVWLLRSGLIGLVGLRRRFKR